MRETLESESPNDRELAQFHLARKRLLRQIK